jgi:hypothetical protein
MDFKERVKQGRGSQDIRLEAPGLTGAALIVEAQPIHLELFVD